MIMGHSKNMSLANTVFDIFAKCHSLTLISPTPLQLCHSLKSEKLWHGEVIFCIYGDISISHDIKGDEKG